MEQGLGLATLVAFILGILDWFIRLWLRRRPLRGGQAAELLKTVNRLHDELRQAIKEREEARQGEAKARAERDDVLAKFNQACEAVAGLQARVATLEDQHRSAELKRKEIHDGLTADLEKARDDLGNRDRLDRTRANLMKGAMRLEGRLWMRKVLRGAPRFRPLSERHAAIISVLNLKGGVGKTTVTAHLGAALHAKGYNVLLLDLDLQGSLSSLFIPEATLAQRSEDEKRLLQHFLLSAAEKRKANLLECRVPIFDGKSAIVPSADSMAYAELNLTMQWLLRLGKRDTRFLLRKALHQKRVTRCYDVVLLDCPPLFNTCCVNALAASDYVLIPVVPSRKAAERVPLLLERLQALHRVINPELRLLGTLLNRTHGSVLTAWEQDLWTDMLEKGQDRWKLPVPAFETTIRQTTEVRDSETEYSPPQPGSELHGLFFRLAAEVEARIPGDCRRTATAPV
jgi:chromosome partitioning protein